MAHRLRVAARTPPRHHTLGERVLGALDILEDDANSPDSRAHALDTLRGLQGDPVRRQVLRALDDPHSEVRAAAVRAAVEETSTLSLSLGDLPAPELSALQVAALSHPDPDVRHRALLTLEPASLTALTGVLAEPLAAAKLPEEVSERCIEAFAQADIEELEAIWRACRGAPTTRAEDVRSTRTLRRRIAVRVPWESHYANAMAARRLEDAPPVWLSGADLAGLDEAAVPQLSVIWHAWIAALAESDPHAEAALDRLTASFLAFPADPATGLMARDLLLVLRGRQLRCRGAEEDAMLPVLLGVVALREPGALVCPAFPADVRHAALGELQALYPGGPPAPPSDPQRRAACFPDRLPNSTARLERLLLQAFVLCGLSGEERAHRRRIEDPRRRLGLGPGPERSLVGLRAAGLPVAPGGGRVFAADFDRWLEPGPERGETLLESWLALLPRGHQAHLVWRHVDEETLVALAHRPAAERVAQQLIASGDAIARRVLRMREPHPLTRHRINGRLMRGPVRLAIENVLRAGHREDIAELLEAPSLLEAIIDVLPAIEPLPLPLRRRAHVEYAGRLLAARLEGDDETTTRWLRHLVSRFDPSREHFGVVFHTLEALGRARPVRLAQCVAEAVDGIFDGSGLRLSGWAKIDTLGEPFHRAVLSLIRIELYRDLYARHRVVRVPEDTGPLSLPSALHRLATGAALPAGRARASVGGWVSPDLLKIEVPSPTAREGARQVQGLMVALLCALRDRIDGAQVHALAEQRAALRAEVEGRLDGLLEAGTEEGAVTSAGDPGEVLAEAGRWAALLGRALGRGRRVRLLGCVGGGGGVEPAEAERWLLGLGGRRRLVLCDGLSALPVCTMLRTLEDGGALAERLGRPGVAEAVHDALSRGLLPGGASEADRLRERLSAGLPVQWRERVGGALPARCFWQWATGASAAVRARLVAHAAQATVARRCELAGSLPWSAAELPDAEVVGALFPRSGPEAAVVAAMEGGLRRRRVGDGEARHTPLRMANCLALLRALPLPPSCLQRWTLHLWRQDTIAWVANLNSPGAEWFPVGIGSRERWGAERAVVCDTLVHALGLPTPLARRLLAGILLKAGSWAEWRSVAERWQEPALYEPAMLAVFGPAHPLRLRLEGRHLSQAFRQQHEARRQQERERIEALGAFFRGVKARRDLRKAGTEEPLPGVPDVPVAGMLLATDAVALPESAALLGAILQQASPSVLVSIVRLLAAVRTPIVCETEVSTPLLQRVAQEGAQLREEVLALVRAIPDEGLQRRAVRALQPEEERLRSLRRLAGLVRYTATLGRRLTGVPTKVRFIGGDDLGFTRLDGHTIWINPVAWFDGVRDGQAIVEGLIAHEIGHLALHAAPAFRNTVDAVNRDGNDVRRWLNIVLDEHLERNLRARDPDLGDALKKLCAWALLHRARRMPAMAVLQRTGLAGLPGGVQTRHLDALPGALLVEPKELPPAPDPGTRFFLGLRLGLGRRETVHGDRQERAHALFGPRFRKQGAKGLVRRARQLQALFGEPNASGLDKVGHRESPEPSVGDPRDAMAHGGWTVIEIEDAARATGECGVLPDAGTELRTIVHNRQSSIVVPPFAHRVTPSVDAATEAELRRRARGFAGDVRDALARVGRATTQERHRPRGRRLDTAGLGQRVVLQDPRLLRRSRPTRHGDLFIGLTVDSSGSMRMLDNLSRAVLFAGITAVAADGLPHVTTRLAGFTHDTLIDLGDARQTRLTALRADGGNNDAAALDWIAEEALASGRRHRLLVMISDGRPTASSEAALAARIRHWEDQGMMLVQLALREIDPPVFPRQVTLAARGEREAVRAWCHLIAGLAEECTA
ncbi:MAG: hypothetical protein EA398_00900 [Deltaproteobacteria bacterium]|nr:MAG: hypothetical protein EA398_00900 [Deltaproteobacteria bacterium]